MVQCVLRHRDLQDVTKNHTHGTSSFSRDSSWLAGSFLPDALVVHAIAFERDRS